MPAYRTVVVTTEFMASLGDFSSKDLRRISTAMKQLDVNEGTTGLNIHLLEPKKNGIWAAYVTKSIRITFRRLDGGRKELLAASHHYGD